MAALVSQTGPTLASSKAHPTPTPTSPPPVVISFSVIPASRGAAILRGIYPHAHITVDENANAVIVIAPSDVTDGMKTIATGIDVKNPTDVQIDAQQLHALPPSEVVARVGGVFPHARLVAAPNKTIVIMAPPSDMAQIKAIITTIDTPPATPSPRPHYPAEAVRVTQRNAREVARAVAHETTGVKVMVSGSEILLSGPQDDVDHAKALIAELDVPQMGTQYTELYHLHYVDASSVADLLKRSFPNLPVQVDNELNAITVLAGTTLQRRIADAIAQLDTAPQGASGGGEAGGGGGGGGGVEVVTLKAAVPGLNGAPSTSATDMATTVTQALQQAAPDLHITVPPNSNQLILSGSPYSIKMAKDLIAQLDVPEPMVVLDTEIYEISESIAKDLGIGFPTGGALISTTFQEEQPVAPVGGTATAPPLSGLMPFYRSVPIQFSLEVGLAISNGKAKVLADPRITTISGRTASIRAGDTISILTTTGGGTGTVATTQVQQFQTGVTLDITPVVNAGDFITMALHPTVNNETGVNNGVPQISTRDTTTTVQMKDNETLIIGGLIQRSNQRTTTKIPILGDLPLIGKIFQENQVNNQDDELVITVTPHIVREGDHAYEPGPKLPDVDDCFGSMSHYCAPGKDHSPPPIPEGTMLPDAESPSGLPTLPPDTHLPKERKNFKPRTLAENTPPPPEPEPSPVDVATPAGQSAITPPPTSGPAPRPTQVSSSPAPGSASASAAPHALPTAFSQTNVYTYGAAPPNNYAAPNQPPQIYYAQVSPSVVQNGQSMTISAITSTNVTKLSFGPSAIVQNASLNSIGAGQWQATFNFSTSGLTAGAGNVQYILTATTGMGQTVSIPIPLSLVAQ